MLRATATGSVFALATLMGLALASTRCWGEPFTTVPPLGGTGAGGAGATGVTGSVNSNVTSGTLGGTMGGVAGGVMDATQVTNTTGAAGESPVRPSPYGDACQELRLPATRDTFIWGMDATGNYDFKALGEDRLEVSQYGTFSKRTLLYFNVYLETAASWSIVAAFLELYVVSAEDYGRVNLHRLMPRVWEERFATWTEFTSGQPWTSLGGDFEPEVLAWADVNPTVENAKISFDLTSEVQALHAGAQGHGWLLKEAGEPEGGALIDFAFAGRDTDLEGEEGPILSIHFCQQ